MSNIGQKLTFNWNLYPCASRKFSSASHHAVILGVNCKCGRNRGACKQSMFYKVNRGWSACTVSYLDLLQAWNMWVQCMNIMGLTHSQKKTIHSELLHCTGGASALITNFGMDHHTQQLWGLEVIQVGLHKCWNDILRPLAPLILLLLWTILMWGGGGTSFIILKLTHNIKDIWLASNRWHCGWCGMTAGCCASHS